MEHRPDQHGCWACIRLLPSMRWLEARQMPIMVLPAADGSPLTLLQVLTSKRDSAELACRRVGARYLEVKAQLSSITTGETSGHPEVRAQSIECHMLLLANVQRQLWSITRHLEVWCKRVNSLHSTAKRLTVRTIAACCVHMCGRGSSLYMTAEGKSCTGLPSAAACQWRPST